ncbi:response regulator transcription factor [Brachybacterium tyrofermentans]|uniref:response regulator transcription factor n=1 Tax=Brachybacterium tyrofermentans TaxID=47848 RepID=UPI003FD270F6
MDRRVAVVVEDDADIRGLMTALLGQSGFEVHEAGSGTAGVKAVREHEPVVVTVDLGLPDIDGYEVTRQVRQFSDAYIVMLTARTEEIDTLLGLEAGADDYVTKPFRPRELRARIEAMLRRPRITIAGAAGSSTTISSAAAQHSAAPLAPPSSPAAAVAALPAASAGSSASVSSGAYASSAAPAPTAPAPTAPAHAAPGGPGSAGAPLEPTADAVPSAAAPSAPAELRRELDGLVLFPALHRVEANGREIPLTPTEFLLLETLMRSGQVVRSKAELARTVRGDDADGGTFVSKSDERTVEVHMGNLRRKLADDPKEPRWLQTVRGVGYRMAGRPVVTS